MTPLYLGCAAAHDDKVQNVICQSSLNQQLEALNYLLLLLYIQGVLERARAHVDSKSLSAATTLRGLFASAAYFNIYTTLLH